MDLRQVSEPLGQADGPQSLETLLEIVRSVLAILLLPRPGSSPVQRLEALWTLGIAPGGSNSHINLHASVSRTPKADLRPAISLGGNCLALTGVLLSEPRGPAWEEAFAPGVGPLSSCWCSPSVPTSQGRGWPDRVVDRSVGG